tara:strand:+ start:794 stop:1732 length:939 start_codon:yes stop_codon:yes gene_type:complete
MADLYQILELDKNASDDEIRKAYRRLSMKWHPDKNKSKEAEEKFKNISNAYSILSDTKQRAQYDNEKNGIDLSTINLPDIFKVFMGAPGGSGTGVPFGFSQGDINIGMMPGGFHTMNGVNTDMYEPSMASFIQNMRKPSPIITTVTISLEEAYEGISIPLKIKRSISNNNSKTYENETIYITIPPGVDDNELIITREKGHVLNDTIKGDVKVFIKIENTTDFKRHGLDLDYTKIISLKDALCGFSFEIQHINGICYKINNTNGTIIHPSYKKTVPKKGMKRDGMDGNLNIHFIIEFPTSLEPTTIEQLKTLL